MSEQLPENPEQAVQPGAGYTSEAQAQPAAAPQQEQAAAASGSEQTFAIRLVKRPTGDTHWNVAKGIYELVTHAETGEPSQEYALLASIDGADVPILTLNAGGIDTIVKSQQQAQQGG